MGEVLFKVGIKDGVIVRDLEFKTSLNTGELKMLIGELEYLKKTILEQIKPDARFERKD